MVQPNMKKLIAYSSVSHLGFVVLGIFSFTQAGLERRHVRHAGPRCLHRRTVHAGGNFATSADTPTRSRVRRARHPDARVRRRSSSSSCWRRWACRCSTDSSANFWCLSGAFQAKPLYGVLGRHGRDLERRIPAVDVPARVLRRSHAPMNNSMPRPIGSRTAALWPLRSRPW